jgi:hypothetical protein
MPPSLTKTRPGSTGGRDGKRRGGTSRDCGPGVDQLRADAMSDANMLVGAGWGDVLGAL